MNKSKILRAVLTAVLTLVATTASAHDFEVNGIYYFLNDDGTVSVTYLGSSYNEYANEYTGDVVIPSSVTYFGTTHSVTSIGNYAFYECRGLTSVTIPNSVISIGDWAFYKCIGLKNVTIPNSVTSIGICAFYGCSGLTRVTIPNSVNSIGSSAFLDCSGLTRVDISSLEAWLGIKFTDTRSNPLYYARHLYLNGKEVKDLVIPNSVTSICGDAFRNCIGLTSVTIPNSVKSIGNYAFLGCSGLTSVTIGNSVTSIGRYTFSGCSGLTSVTIPNSVTSIGYGAFDGCSGLTRVDISSLEAWLGIKFTDTRSNPLYYARHLYLNGEEVKDLVIPNSVTSIGEYAFLGCIGLTSVSIPNSVTSIGSEAFEGCSGLTRVDISSLEAWLGIKFADSYSNPLLYAQRLYLNGEEVKDLVIPNSVKSIGNYAFLRCSGLTSVTIPNSVTSIGSHAFSSCSGLTSFTIPNSVTSIGYGAFDGCSGLTSVSIPNSVTSIGDLAFSGCSGLTNVSIGNSVTSIGDYAFQYCSGLETIFYNAENCTDITNNSYVFNYGTNIIIGKDVKNVPNYLFYYLDYAPTSVISKSVTPPTCGANSFSSNAYTAKLYVPSGAIADYKAANVWKNFTTIEGIGTNDAVNVADLIEGTNRVNFGLQGVKMHDGVLYACTTAESVNKSNPTLHGNAPDNMDTYEDHNFADFDQRDWVAISGLEDGFVGKELSYPFVATFAEGVLTPSETINANADATAYKLNTFRAENILHGGYSNYAEGDYKAYYVPARVNEVANFMGLIENVGGVKYLYSNNAYGRKDGEGIKIEGNIADNSKSYSLLEGILVADASTKAGVKIIMLQDLGEATGVEGVDTAAARIYTANGNIIIAATEDGEAAVYDFTGRLIKSVPVASGDSTAVPVTPGYYIVKTGTKTQSVVVK